MPVSAQRGGEPGDRSRAQGSGRGSEPRVVAEDLQGLSQPGLLPVPGLYGSLRPLRRHAPVADPLGGTAADGSIVQALRRRRGGGRRLPGSVADPMGQELGIDVSALRVHADPEAGSIARSVRAEAFTYGNDIYFAPGSYQPSSGAGQRVLGHELSHVAAQRSGADGGSTGPSSIGRADDPAEAAGDRSADRVVGALRRSRNPEPVMAAADPYLPIDPSVLRHLRRSEKGMGEEQAEAAVEQATRGGIWAGGSRAHTSPIRRLHISGADVSARAVADGLRRSSTAGRAEVPPSPRSAVAASAGGGSNVDGVSVRMIRRLKGLTERERRERARMWAERIQPRVPGISLADARAMCDGLVDTSMSVNQAEALAQLVVDGWSAPLVAALGRKFVADNGGLLLANWLRIAGQLPDQPENAAAFARAGNNWTPMSCVALATEFARNSGGARATDWVRIARAGGRLLNQADDVAWFARMAGWNLPNKVNLAMAYAVAPAPRLAQYWASIATATPGVANREAEVAAFAQADTAWSAPRLAGLIGRFAADPGGRPAADWVALAGADPALVDRDDAVAKAARAAWTAAELGPVVVAALAAGTAAPGLTAYLAQNGAAAALRPMIVGGWTGQDLGSFLGTLLRHRTTPVAVSACLSTPNMVQATLNMRIAWTPIRLANFVRGAMERPTPNAALEALMATPNFPASSHALVTPTWTSFKVGQYGGGSVVAGASGAQVHSLASTQHVPARLQAMTTAGWNQADLGAFMAGMQLEHLDDATIETLMQQAKFRTGSFKMHVATWDPKLNGNFVAGAHASGLTVPLLSALVDHAGFGAASKKWLPPWWTATEVGTIAGKARTAGLMPTALTAFFDTANAAASAHALDGQAGWDPAEVGETIGHCLTRPGKPTAAQMERLLFLADTPINAVRITPAWVRTAADGATCGAPSWADVIARAPQFQASWAGPRAGAAGPSILWQGAGAGPAYRIRLRIPATRVEHVEKGHTWEYSEFTYANCTRAGVGANGQCTFFAPGKNIPALMVNVRDDPAVRNLAENAAENCLPHHPGLPTQGFAQGCTVGVFSAPPGGGPNPISDAHISQCYPNAGTGIRGKDLVAIGRYFGEI